MVRPRKKLDMKATHCWQVDGAWRVGRPLSIQFRGDAVRSLVCDSLHDIASSGITIVQHYHTGKIEAVPVAWLKAYPVEEIKQP